MKKLCFALVVFVFNNIYASLLDGFSGPCVITKGGTYIGKWQSEDPNVPAVTIRTSEPVDIKFSIIVSKGDLIVAEFKDVDLRIQYSIGIGENSGVYGKGKGWFLEAKYAKQIIVENCNIESCKGIRILGWKGNITPEYTDGFPNTKFSIKYNKVKNCDGRQSDGNGGYLQDVGIDAWGCFVNIFWIHNSVGSEIAYNEIINEPNQSNSGDVISFYMANGKSSNSSKPKEQIRVHHNFIKGAYPYPATSSSYAGGGILLGDASPIDGICPTNLGQQESDICRFIKCYDNIIVSTSNKGIGNANGQYIEAYNNRIVSSGYFTSGSPIPSQMANTTGEGPANSVGMYNFDYYNWENAMNSLCSRIGTPGQPLGYFKHNIFHNNYIRWNKGGVSNPVMEQQTGSPCCPTNCSPSCVYIKKEVQCADIDPINGNNCSFNANEVPTLYEEDLEFQRWNSYKINQNLTIGAPQLIRLNQSFVYSNQIITAPNNTTNYIVTNNDVELRDNVDVIVDQVANNAVDIFTNPYVGNLSALNIGDRNYCVSKLPVIRPIEIPNFRKENEDTLKIDKTELKAVSRNTDTDTNIYKSNFNSILISPNPSDRIFNILFLEITKNNKDIYLLDLNGNELIKLLNYDKNEYELDLEMFPKGIYFIKVSSKEFNFVKKLVLF